MKIESKFDKSHGKGLKPPHLSHPGQVAPMTGTTVAGHNENGSKYPTKGTLKLGRGEHRPALGKGKRG